MRKMVILFSLFSLSAAWGAQLPQVKPVRAVIAAVEGDGAKLEAQFNPREIAVDKSVPWQAHKGAEGDAPALEFTTAKPKTMTVTLLFDTFEERVSVYDRYISRLETLTLVDQTLRRPPLVTFTWGSSLPVFKGVIESLNVKYILFLPDGTPCRATATLGLTEAEKALDAPGGAPAACATDADCAAGMACVKNFCTTRN